MSRPLASALEVASLLTQLTNQQAVNPPTSTAQIGAQLTITSVKGSDRPEPVLSKKDVPKSPFDVSADSSSVSGSVLGHCAPVNRAQSASASLAITPTTTPGLADTTLTMTDLTEAASKGDAIAQFELAKLFYQGVDGAVNYEEALKWYTQSAEQGNFNAQHNLALMYYKGEGVHKAVAYHCRQYHCF